MTPRKAKLLKAPPAGEKRIDYVPLADVAPATRNPKEHDVEGLKTSLRRFGYADTVVLDERTQRKISGHGRWEALAEMEADGEAPPAGVKIAKDGKTYLVPLLRGWSSNSDTEAEGYLIAANQHGENGGWNRDMLAMIMRDLADADSDLPLAAGMPPDTLASLLSELEHRNENPHDYRPPRDADSPDGFPSFDADMDTDYSCPRCGHGWNGNPKPLGGGNLGGGDPDATYEGAPDYDGVFPRVPDAD